MNIAALAIALLLPLPASAADVSLQITWTDQIACSKIEHVRESVLYIGQRLNDAGALMASNAELTQLKQEWLYQPKTDDEHLCQFLETGRYRIADRMGKFLCLAQESWNACLWTFANWSVR